MTSGRRAGLAIAGASLAIAGVILWKRKGEPMFDVRTRIVNWAESQEGESDSAPYWYSAIGRPASSPDVDWCGAFVLTALHRQGLALDRQWALGRGLEATLPLLERTRAPEPGDIAYFAKNQHVAIVADVTPTHVRLVNGNSGGGTGRVLINERLRTDATAYYSIERYLPKEAES